MSETENFSALLPLEDPRQCAELMEALHLYIPKKKEIIFLHVLDTLVLDPLKDYNESLRQKAIEDLKTAKNAQFEAELNTLTDREGIHTMIVEGAPYLEILKIARDLKVDLIAMKIRSGGKDLEKLIFGTTAERVLRGTSIPVLCLP